MTTLSTKTAYSKPQLEEMAESVGFWWHSIDLGQGVVTKGYKKPETLRYELESLQLPDLRDKTVLDIGAWDGFQLRGRKARGVWWRSMITSGHSTSPSTANTAGECKER